MKFGSHYALIPMKYIYLFSLLILQFLNQASASTIYELHVKKTISNNELTPGYRLAVRVQEESETIAKNTPLLKKENAYCLSQKRDKTLSLQHCGDFYKVDANTFAIYAPMLTNEEIQRIFSGNLEKGGVFLYVTDQPASKEEISSVIKFNSAYGKNNLLKIEVLPHGFYPAK